MTPKEVRIGKNVLNALRQGDMDNILGDAVNIAARLEVFSA